MNAKIASRDTWELWINGSIVVSYKNGKPAVKTHDSTLYGNSFYFNQEESQVVIVKNKKPLIAQGLNLKRAPEFR